MKDFLAYSFYAIQHARGLRISKRQASTSQCTTSKTIETRSSFLQVDEQRAIATILSDMDAEIEALEARRDKTQALKQGMMQELLTGRTRLV